MNDMSPRKKGKEAKPDDDEHDALLRTGSFARVAWDARRSFFLTHESKVSSEQAVVEN